MCTLDQLSTYVIVSGVPAAGKSRVGAALASEATLPVFDKDDFLEQLFSGSIPTTPAERRKLSREADHAFRSAVQSSRGAIAVSWWKHPRSIRDSGTPTDWLLNLPGHLVEVYCKCDAAAAIARFRSRKRHPGHLDQFWSHQELSAFIHESSALGPLALGRVVEVDCSGSIDYKSVWNLVVGQCE
jgi:gluconate kinase